MSLFQVIKRDMFFFGEKQGLQNREIPINLSEVNQIVSATSRHIKRKQKEKEKFKNIATIVVYVIVAVEGVQLRTFL